MPEGRGPSISDNFDNRTRRPRHAGAETDHIGSTGQCLRCEMKIIFSFLFVLSAVITATAQAQAQTDPHGWINFAPEGAGFSILFPTQPVENINKKTAYTLHSFTTNANRATYVAAYSDYEEIKLKPAEFLAANRDRFNKGLQATPISSREI